jgi:magnesium-transporting ATPase (P-type)
VSPSSTETSERRRAPEQPWHALAREEVVAELDTTENGLSGDAAGRRLEQYGPNELEAEEPLSNVAILLRQFTSPLIYILLVAAVVTVAIQEFIDTGVIVAVLVLNAVVGFVQERKAEQAVRSLMQLAAPRSVVVRDGEQLEVDSRALVPGDVVVLESGTRVPADLRILVVTALRVDESLLTGESNPVTKRVEPVGEDTLAADRSCMTYMGTVVASGRGRGVVVATGTETELGQISERVRSETHPESPLTRRMNRFANIIALAVTGSAILTFLLGLFLGQPSTEMFLTAVALAVAIVPEGLPVALTVALALGVRRMAARNAIIRNLPAVETLGSTNTIGSDKTGTLTENRMTVQRVWAADTTYTPADAPAEDSAEPLRPDLVDVHGPDPLSMTMLAGVLTNEAQLTWRDGEAVGRGDPTEVALLVAASRAELHPVDVRSAYPTVAEVPFEPDLRYSLSVHRHADGHIMFVKGAPERVLELCSSILGTDGVTALEPERVLAEARAMAADGLRVLAMAYRPLEAIEPGDEPPDPQELVLAGLQGMLDPPRRGVPEAIRGCHEAGMRVVMITGDHPETARAIAHRVGIVEDQDAPVVSGRDMESLTDEELEDAVLDVDVYARVSPDHKYRIVRALRSHGEVTGVTGDGVNDAPALRAADIGIAMGVSGTDVAREASDMVLADDNFVSIYDAVGEGRVVFDNVRKVTFFLISTGVAAIVVLLYALAAGLPMPLLPAQLLWLNVVTNGLQDVALAFEPGERDVLDQPPRRRDEPVVPALLWERTAFTGLTMAIGTIVMFHWALEQGFSEEQLRATALTTLVVFMAFHVGNSRSERRSLFRMPPLSNPFLFVATAGALTIHALALRWQPTQFVLRIEPIGLEAWVRLVLIASTVIVVSEAHKALRRAR